MPAHSVSGVTFSSHVILRESVKIRVPPISLSPAGPSLLAQQAASISSSSPSSVGGSSRCPRAAPCPTCRARQLPQPARRAFAETNRANSLLCTVRALCLLARARRRRRAGGTARPTSTAAPRGTFSSSPGSPGSAGRGRGFPSGGWRGGPSGGWRGGRIGGDGAGRRQAERGAA